MANGDDVEDDDDWFGSLLGDENPVETGLPGVRSLMVMVSHRVRGHSLREVKNGKVFFLSEPSPVIVFHFVAETGFG